MTDARVVDDVRCGGDRCAGQQGGEVVAPVSQEEGPLGPQVEEVEPDARDVADQGVTVLESARTLPLVVTT